MDYLYFNIHVLNGQSPDFAEARWIVCVWNSGTGLLTKRGYMYSLYAVAWWWITITARCRWKVHSGLFFCFSCTSFGPNHRSLRFDMLFILSYPNHFLHKTQAHTLPFLSACRRMHSPPHYLNVVRLVLVWPLLSSSPYFLFRWLLRHGKCQALFASAVWLLQTFVKC